MKTKYEQIVNVTEIGKRSKVDVNAIYALAVLAQLAKASSDDIKRLVLCIDEQNDFVEGGALPVPGACDDIERLTRFIYNNLESITCIMSSLDTHSVYQIFHPSWWVNPKGEHVEPYTIITYDDVVSGRWIPTIGNPNDSVEYVQELEKASNGKEQLCIWPYHCIKGTEGNALESEFAKMVYFHSAARQSANPMIIKGEDPYSEMYGIIKPEYSKGNYLNTEVLAAIEEYDEIYVAGEAASHCLKKSVMQIAEHFADRPEITKKITVLKDCTSPIPGFEESTKAEFEKLSKEYGIKFVKSTDIKF